jgi:hypothetical protein
VAKTGVNRRRKTSPALDDIVPKRGRPPGAKDEVTSTLLATGQATFAQIAQLFETDAKTLPKRLKGVIPKGTRSGYKVYSIREAAEYLVTPGYEIEDFIRQMSPQELPPLLSKEFWNGQNARLNYEKSLGNLWPTDDVVAAFGEILNVVRMAVLLVADDVDRESGLTPGQRLIIRRIMDGMIVKLGQDITDKFKEYHANRAPTGFPLRSDEDDLDDDADDENITAEDDEEEDDGNLLAAEDDEEEDDYI